VPCRAISLNWFSILDVSWKQDNISVFLNPYSFWQQLNQVFEKALSSAPTLRNMCFNRITHPTILKLVQANHSENSRTSKNIFFLKKYNNLNQSNLYFQILRNGPSSNVLAVII
jgi:hypothetical protein